MRCLAPQVVLVAALSIGPAFTATANSDDAGQDRQTYLAAQDAIRAGNVARFRQLRSQLDGYVLRGYLDYELLKDRVPTTPKEVLHGFLADNQDAPVSNYLRARWLHHLIRQQEWTTFLREYADMEEEPDLNCHRLNYLMRISKEQSGLMQETGRLWLNGNKLPSACDPVIAAWRKAGYMTTQLVWERVGLAMERRNLTLAESLGVYLDKDDRAWLSRWLAMHRNPAHELAQIRYPVETPVARQIVRHGVMRLAFNDPAEAMRRWEALKEKYEFFGEDENYVLRWVGILAAQKHLPRAVEWLSSVSAGADDESLRQWRVRAALRAGQWQTGAE